MHSMLKLLLIALLFSFSASASVSFLLCEDFTNGTCVDSEGNEVPETDSFLNTLDEAFFYIVITNEPAGTIKYEIRDPDGNFVEGEGPTESPIDIESHVYLHTFEIANKNREVGTWSMAVLHNGQSIGSMDFEIVEGREDYLPCAGFCCPESKTCRPGHEMGAIDCPAKCCDSEDYCVDIIEDFGKLEVQTLLFCDPYVFNDCKLVQGNIYNYSVHGSFPEGQKHTLTFSYTNHDIRCYDKTAVNIAYYDEVIGRWIPLDSIVSHEEGSDNYDISAVTYYLGYMTIVSNEKCVASDCSFGPYVLSPFGGLVGVDKDLSIIFCGLVPKCNADEGDGCSANCVYGVDSECGACSPDSGDCCLPSRDLVCDLDCYYPNIDPDCCDKDESGCCFGGLRLTGSDGCDNECGKHDFLEGTVCTDCTNSANDCCFPSNEDGVCDIDCGGIDPDCCAGYTGSFTPADEENIKIFRRDNGCCDMYCDGLCDSDCIEGTDPDCVGYCDRTVDLCSVTISDDYGSRTVSGTKIAYVYTGYRNDYVSVGETVLIGGDYEECVSLRG